MKRLIACGALALFAACGGPRVEIISQEDLDPKIYGDSGVQRTANLVLYLVEGNRLVRVTRTGRSSKPEEDVAVRELLAGPTSQELAQGIETRIPDDVELLGIDIEGDVAMVNLSGSFQVVQDPDDTHEYVLRMAQLVWTLDELPSINAVQLVVEGQAYAVIDHDGREVAGPVARNRYNRFEPRQDRPVSVAPLQTDL